MAGVNFELEGEVFPADLRPKPARRARLREGRAQHLTRERVFEAHVDVTLARPDRVAREDHALDERVRVVFHQVAVNVSARVALIGVGDDVFLAGGLGSHRAPLAPGGEARAAASTQLRSFDRSEHLFRRLPERLLERAVAAELFVSRERPRAPRRDAAQHDSFAGENFHRRTRVCLALGRSREAFAETVDAGILRVRLGPARGIEVLGREARRALARLARVLAMRQVIEGLDIGGERVLGTG